MKGIRLSRQERDKLHPTIISFYPSYALRLATNRIHSYLSACSKGGGKRELKERETHVKTLVELRETLKDKFLQAVVTTYRRQRLRKEWNKG